MLIPFYTFLGSYVAPAFLRNLIKKRLKRGKEDPSRFQERFGGASIPRPEGQLLWIHGASLGETKTALCLVERFLKTYPHASVLVTSGTTSSAKMLEDHLPKGALHQYVPLDTAPWVTSFLDFWRPDAALWMESEIWPTLIKETQKRGIPAGLVNAHLSEESRRLWRFFPQSARSLFGGFQVILPQNQKNADFFNAFELRETQVQSLGNLKFSLPLLPDKESLRLNLRDQIGERPFWLAASTHPGEEEILAQVHIQLKRHFPDLVTLLAPRHPDRCDRIEKSLSAEGLTCQRHSKTNSLNLKTDFYLMDSFGDLGFLYRLSEIVFMGGSLVSIGGHNLIEPAQLSCAILHGPHMESQTEMVRLLNQNQATRQISDVDSLAQSVRELLISPQERKKLGDRALQVVQKERGVLDKTWSALSFLSVFDRDLSSNSSAMTSQKKEARG